MIAGRPSFTWQLTTSSKKFWIISAVFNSSLIFYFDNLLLNFNLKFEWRINIWNISSGSHRSMWLLWRLWSLVWKWWMDFKAALRRLSTRGLGKRPLSPPLCRPSVKHRAVLHWTNFSLWMGFTFPYERHHRPKMWFLSPGTKAAMRGPKPLLFLAPLVLLVLPTLNFELQDTIHALIEENIHLHDQLENLTNALKELKRMLWHHTNGTQLCSMQPIK